MVRILKSELFISLMQAVFLAGIFELFLGQGHTSSAVIYAALLFGSIGLLSGLTLKAVIDRKR